MGGIQNRRFLHIRGVTRRLAISCATATGAAAFLDGGCHARCLCRYCDSALRLVARPGEGRSVSLVPESTGGALGGSSNCYFMTLEQPNPFYSGPRRNRPRY